MPTIDESVRDAALEELFRRVEPIVDGIVGYYRRRGMLDHSESEDVSSIVRMRLLLKLQRLARGEGEPIAAFDGYAARLTYNAVNDVFRDRRPQRAFSAAEAPPESVIDADTPLLRLQRREDLTALWSEILLLPPAQRAALLLNLRGDGSGSAIALLVLLGVTTFDALAAALAMRAEELAEIWSALPLDDLSIAARLGVTRQQVINLRKSARRRLERRVGNGNKVGSAASA